MATPGRVPSLAPTGRKKGGGDVTEKGQAQHEANLRAVMAVIGGDFCHGTTYRRWLVGQALAGGHAKGNSWEDGASIAINAADAVLRQLAEEHLALDEERT